MRLPFKKIRLLLPAILFISLAACSGGTVLRTMEASGIIGTNELEFSIVLDHGSLSIVGDTSLIDTAAAVCVVRDRGLIGMMSGSADPTALTLVIGTNDGKLSVNCGSSEENLNLDFELTVRIPASLYLKALPGYQNVFETMAGSLHVSNIRGNHFYIWSSPAINGTEYPMTIHNVQGSIQCNSSGSLTITGSPNIVLAQSDGVLDMTVTGHPNWQMPKLGATDHVILRVKRGLNVTFLHEADIKPQVHVHDSALLTRDYDDGIYQWFEVKSGTGTDPGLEKLSVMAYQVWSYSGSIDYYTAD